MDQEFATNACGFADVLRSHSRYDCVNLYMISAWWCCAKSHTHILTFRCIFNNTFRSGHILELKILTVLL